MPPIQYHYDKFPPKEFHWKRVVPLIEPTTLALGDWFVLTGDILEVYVFHHNARVSFGEAVLGQSYEAGPCFYPEVYR